MSSTHRHTLPGTHEHEYEPQYGLPERLPPDERLIWQGSPHWWSLAKEAFHIRGLALYFAVMLGIRAWYAASDGGTLGEALVAVGWLSPLVVFVLGVTLAAAWASAHLAVYTITSRRVVMRIGIVLTISYNLPFKQLRSAALHTRRDGTGDVVLELAPNGKVGFVNLWPHARPWRVSQPQPMLRSLSGAEQVAQLLTAAWAEFHRTHELPHAVVPVAAPRRPSSDGMPAYPQVTGGVASGVAS